LAIRPRITLARAGHEAMSIWTKRFLTICALVAAVIAGYSMINPGTTAAPDTRQPATNRASDWQSIQRAAIARPRASRPQSRSDHNP
jgi:hypothetical protein